MFKTTLAILIIIVAGTAIFFWPKTSLAPLPSPQVTICTKEAKLCPDGSAVGREGPNCQFAACPSLPQTSPPATTKPAQQIFCTMEAKLCPDGSAVGRTGPRCEFAACPVAGVKTTINGTVSLSPTCPVERMPPDPNCAPKPLATNIQIVSQADKAVVKTIQSDNNGQFQTTLPNGQYSIQAQSGKPYPRCTALIFNIPGPNLANLNLTCDTGIR